LEEKNVAHTHFEITTAILIDVLEQSLSNNHSVQDNYALMGGISVMDILNGRIFVYIGYIFITIILPP